MVEFAVSVASLSLLLLGMQALAGMQEVQRRAVMAARELTLVESWHAGRVAAQPVARLHANHFAGPGYMRPYDDEAWLLEQDVEAGRSPRVLGGSAGTATEALLRPLQVTGGLLGAGFDLEPGGYQTGEVQARMRPDPRLPEPFDALDLRLQAAMHVLGNGWSAAGSVHVETRTAALVPTSPLRELSRGWQSLAAPLAIVEPNIDRLCLGLIDAEWVPEDRLGPGTSPAAGQCP